MKTTINQIAIFRMSVLGQLIARNKLERGELSEILDDLSSKNYNIPHSKHTRLSKKTIEKWYYVWLKLGIDGLAPKERSDKGCTQISSDLQEHIVELKHANPARSVNTILSLLERQKFVNKGELARSTLYRFLKKKNLNVRTVSGAETIERRSFVAEHAGDIWQADVMHGPKIHTKKGLQKVYLVSLLDDATRFIMDSAFCMGETALDIEGVLMQAVLKRGLPKKIIVDNGSAYRSGSLQRICVFLGINLIYCKPYEPEGKGKLERWHRTLREQFIAELNISSIRDLSDLNDRFLAWLDRVYHRNPHSGLDNRTPLECWRQGLTQLRQLGSLAPRLKEIFYHRHKRKVKKDGTVSWNNCQFEAPFKLVGLEVYLVVDPHADKALWVESESGDNLGAVTLLDKISNNDRKRSRPAIKHTPIPKSTVN